MGVLTVGGMTCQACVNTIQSTLRKMPEVQHTDVKVGEARVTFNPKRVNIAQLEEEISSVGFDVKSFTVDAPRVTRNSSDSDPTSSSLSPGSEQAIDSVL